MTTKNKTTKFISALLIISILLPSVALFSKPKQAEAQWLTVDIPHNITSVFNGIFQGVTSGSTVANTALHVKDFAIQILQTLLKMVAKRVLAAMTQATINWINSGFHGSPLFISNPESFFKDIAKSQVQSMIDMIGYDTFRFPFGKQTALNVIASYKSQLATNAQYSLSKVINDPDLLIKYRNDFNYGGWNGFLTNTQYPQNNYLGFQNIIQQNLASHLQGTLVAPAQKIQQTLQQGMGFLSPQECPTNPLYNNGYNEFVKPKFKATTKPIYVDAPEYKGNNSGDYAKYEADLAAAKQKQDENDEMYRLAVIEEQNAWAVKNDCPGGLKTTTPGSVAANHVMSAINSPFLTTALDGAIGNSLAAIFDALINHFLDQGLSALANVVNPSPSDDNWSYQGQTLNGSVAGSNDNSARVTGTTNINIPKHDVAVIANPTTGTSNTFVTTYDTTTMLSGGTGTYGINTLPNTTIAEAKINRNTVTGVSTLTIHGKTKGSTSVIVQDSSTPKKLSTINILVSNSGDLVASPKEVWIDVGKTSTPITLSGATGVYEMVTGPDERIAVASFSGTTLIITGQAGGETSVTIQVQGSDLTRKPYQSITIPIHIGAPTTLVVTPSEIVVDMSTTLGKCIVNGQVYKTPQNQVSLTQQDCTSQTTDHPIGVWSPSSSATISGGTPPYFIYADERVPDTKIAIASVSGNNLSVYGVKGGETAVFVTDSTNPQKLVSANIKVTGVASTDPKGNCNVRNQIVTNTKAECDTLGGTNWVQTTGGTTGGASAGQCGPANRKSPCGVCRLSASANFDGESDTLYTYVEDMNRVQCTTPPSTGVFFEYAR